MVVEVNRKMRTNKSRVSKNRGTSTSRSRVIVVIGIGELKIDKYAIKHISISCQKQLITSKT